MAEGTAKAELEIEAQPLIEGGSTAEEPSKQIIVEGPRDPERHRQIVTLLLIGLLAVIVIGHYACVVVLEWNSKKFESVNNAFNATLPVIAGLVGSAVTYYFSRSGGQRN